jgi:hypothetical protein
MHRDKLLGGATADFLRHCGATVPRTATSATAR